MASSSLSSTTPAANSAVVTKCSGGFQFRAPASLSFGFSPNTHLRLYYTKGLQPSKNSVVVKAQLNEVSSFQWFSLEDLFTKSRSFLDMLLGSSVPLKVSVDGSSNAAPTPPSKSEAPSAVGAKDEKSSDESSPPTLATEESISEFINQVSSLIKLVDSRDIVELQLKQLDCEILIRKKEAMPQPPSPAPVPFTMMHAPPPQPVMTAAPPAPATSSPTPATSAPAAPKAPKSSSHSPLKCPMAGTFYRCAGPGEPPFVKVGDKVKKGQVVCIIEAMKLMNEIEADQSGTVVDILVEDGKPVSVDMPLFLIEPIQTTSETQTIYDHLRSQNLPIGLLPTGITNYSMNQSSGFFQINLTQPCNAKFENQFYYDLNITGVLSNGKIGNLSGVLQQELFLWFPVKEVRVDVPSKGLIYFDVGVVDKQFSLSLFENPVDCTPAAPHHLAALHQAKTDYGCYLMSGKSSISIVKVTDEGDARFAQIMEKTVVAEST
ncbi:hypothetical protein ACFE04_027895 [Oxalis oulophora]